MNYKKLFSMTLLCCSLWTLCSGCAHMVPISVQPTALAAGDKLPLTAALVMNKDLLDYKYEFHMMGDTWVYRFGEPLQDYARRLAGASFQRVEETSSTESAFAIPSADIVLVPRPVKADESTGLMAKSKVNLTLVIEWTAKDRATQNTVWLKTITANASEVQGSVFSGHKHQGILMQKLFDDLSAKTREAFQSASELRSPLHP
jgi:hypothetical protein